ncbi:hypothetical protein LPLM1_00128 [Listeria phage LPML1]|nr:hypothetical protein LPLM1_00128 [Listeria phage LPML1]
MQKIVIGLNGIARSGKDTAAKFMKGFFEEKGMKTASFYFAERLKDTVDSVFGFDERHRDGILKEEIVCCNAKMDWVIKCMKDVLLHDVCETENEANRLADFITLNLVATLMKESIAYSIEGDSYTFMISPRRIYQVFGTDVVRANVKDSFWTDIVKNQILRSDADVVFVTDVRFDNECEMIEDLDESGIQSWIFKVERPNLTTKVTSHVSEKGISDCYVYAHLVNDKGLEEFKELIFKRLDLLVMP